MKLKEALAEAPVSHGVDYQDDTSPHVRIAIYKSPNGSWVAELEELDGQPAKNMRLEGYGVKLTQKGKSGHEALQLMAQNFNKAGFLE